jgi:peptide-methionine (S)-S-oxide reductase
MSDQDPQLPSPRALPARPSAEHLKKQAKRLAKARGLVLAEAQRHLARDYGFKTWTALMARVRAESPGLSPLSRAAAAGDAETVRRLLAEGHPADGAEGETATPLWNACASKAPSPGRLAVAQHLIAAGASLGVGATAHIPLHAAAARGPAAMVELLIRSGAIDWLPDHKDRDALTVARQGKAEERQAIIDLLDRSMISDPSFRAAVEALRAGDVAALAQLLDAEPRLLHDRILGPACYRQSGRSDYFRDPKLFWFVAGNPTWPQPLPPNLVEVTRAMIKRGVEQADLDYALALVVTSAAARKEGQQVSLIHALVKAGAALGEGAADSALAHGEIDAVRAMVDAGLPVTLPVAAGLGLEREVEALLPESSREARHTALAQAVILGHADIARRVLDAGDIDINAHTPVHNHATPLHHAALYGHADVVRLLLDRGADPGLTDDLWNGTPLGWAIHGGESALRTRAILEDWLSSRA